MLKTQALSYIFRSFLGGHKAICMLGNANCVLSSERRKTVLMKIDPQLVELAKDIAKYVNTFASLDKSQL